MPAWFGVPTLHVRLVGMSQPLLFAAPLYPSLRMVTMLWLVAFHLLGVAMAVFALTPFVSCVPWALPVIGVPNHLVVGNAGLSP